MNKEEEEKYVSKIIKILATLETYIEHGTLEEKQREFPKLLLKVDELKEEYFADIDRKLPNRIRRFCGLKSKIPNGKFNTVLVALMTRLLEENKNVGILDE